MAALTRRPRLLFLCQTLPYPPDGGVWIRTYHIIRLLAAAFDITALCFERAGSAGANVTPLDAAAEQGLGRFASVELFPIPQRQSRFRFVYDHLRSLALRRVYTTYVYDSRALQQRLAALLDSTTFDLVHVDSLDLARYLPACRGIPVVCVHHDIESALLRRRAAVEEHALKSAYFRYQSRRMEEVEREWCGRVALNVTVSERDAQRVAQIAPQARVAVVPNGVDIETFRPDDTPGAGVAFVGGTNPFPNLDALNFFAADVLPHLRAQRQLLPIKWIGRASDDQREHFASQHGIELTGYVDDVRPMLREAACHVVPLRVGGGTRLKILNSWAMGKPVISTSVGCEGLAASDGDNILIRDEPGEFARAILDVIGDLRLQRRLGERGRATAERFYGWDAIGRDMRAAYLDIANTAPTTVWQARPVGAPGFTH